MTTPDPEFLINLVREVAAAQILPRFRNLAPEEVSAKSDAFDLVTLADQNAERDMTAAITARYPGTLVIGEEAISACPDALGELAAAESCVIIDPVDGTGNFVAGLATFGVILAVTCRGETQFGVLYDPVVDDWCVGERGQGAWYVRPGRESVRLHTRAPRPLKDAQAFIAIKNGLSDKRGFSRFGHLRSLGCCCHEYRTMLFGQADFMQNWSRKPWDHAAGVMLVTEAGGTSDTSDGTPYHPTSFKGPFQVAANTEIMAQVRAD